jgi:hypothetical protein
MTDCVTAQGFEALLGIPSWPQLKAALSVNTQSRQKHRSLTHPRTMDGAAVKLSCGRAKTIDRSPNRHYVHGHRLHELLFHDLSSRHSVHSHQTQTINSKPPQRACEILPRLGFEYVPLLARSPMQML